MECPISCDHGLRDSDVNWRIQLAASCHDGASIREGVLDYTRVSSQSRRLHRHGLAYFFRQVIPDAAAGPFAMAGILAPELLAVIATTGLVRISD